MNSLIIIYFIIVLILAFFTERWLRKKLKIGKRGFGTYKGVNTAQRWIERTLLVVFLISIWFIDNPVKLFIAFFLTLYSFRAFMEWKYEKEKMEYIITFSSIIVYLTIIGISFYFNII
ncbi:DUF4181 domain-containing protein [Cytobacillus sp. FSL R5-0596]|uniref:DUF4181 domain-containing protein n=1 Tax=Cytobacillus sp. FSL R5-0596 TaxID=2954696 RepID=UPI004046FE46